jgi:hypothetical protein
MRISIELSEEQAKMLRSNAERLGLTTEDLARASLVDLLGQLQDDFKKAASYVMRKNRDLYLRLR